MQPTPAPTSPPSSPGPGDPGLPRVDEDIYPEPPKNFGSAPFSVLAELFDKLQDERKHEKRRRMLDTWFNHWRKEKGHDLYPVLRLMLPQKDRERSVYGMKEKNLAKTYIQLIPLGARDPDAIRLLHWKRPSGADKAHGDFSAVLFEAVSARSSVIEGRLSIEELNGILDELSENMGKKEVQSKIMQKIYNRTTPEEQRWIVRIILKDMNISVKETTIFSVFHPNAQDLFNSCSDLKKVAWELWDPSRRLNEEDTTVRIFSAFAPMLCRRPTKNIDETVREMQGASFIIEEKLDGERMQLHKRGNEFFFCSRKGKDYTYLYGKHLGEGSLAQFITGAFDSRIHSIILDGEMLVWDPVSERNLPFGTLKTAALDKTRKQSSPRPCFKVFDLLYLNGQSLLKYSTITRKKNMRAYIHEVPGRLEFTKEFTGKTAGDIREKMDAVMNDRGEGLVIKHPKAEYGLNARNKDWIKVKPEYMDNLGETFDLLVVAGSYGSRSKHSGAVSTLICAAFEDRGTISEDEPMYTTFVRIGTGLSYADYLWIRSKPWKQWDRKNPPAWLKTAAKGDEDKGDLYLEPQDSFIVKVKAAEITATAAYHIGWTMRFPRAVGIRDDLTIMDCASATAVLQQARSLTNKRKVVAGEMDSLPSRKKRKTTRTAAKPTILPQYVGPSLKDIPVQSSLFEEMKFKVEPDPKSFSGEQDKAEISKLIHANGGALAQVIRPAHNFFVVFEGRSVPHGLQMAINKGMIDVIRPNWIQESVREAECVPFEKRHFFAPSDVRREDEGWEDVDFQDLAGEKADSDREAVPRGSASPAAHTPTIKEEGQSPWFQAEAPDVRKNKGKRKGSPDDDSATESETDYDSDGDRKAGDPDLEGPGVEVEDEWVGKEEDDDTQTLATEDGEGVADTQYELVPEVKMGEDDEAMHYDTERIFRHLVFYLDTPANAKAHDIAVKTSKFEKDIVKSFTEVEEKLTSNGGRVTSSLDDPKLTHVVLDTKDTSRRIVLGKRTSKPKRRYLVVSDWVDACLGEETLLEESEFAP